MKIKTASSDWKAEYEAFKRELETNTVGPAFDALMVKLKAWNESPEIEFMPPAQRAPMPNVQRARMPNGVPVNITEVRKRNGV